MAGIPVGPKTLGTGTGLIAAINYAPDATLVSMYYMGFAVDPAAFEKAVQSLVQGEIPMTFNTLPEVMGQITGGQVRPIAVTTAKRTPALPDVPTIAEAGVPGYAVEIWQGWMGPAGMPAPLVEKIHASIAKAMTSPTLRKRFAEVAAEPVATSPAEFAKEMQSELSKWTPVVKTANIIIE